MKLAIIALASAFVLSSTFALATTTHHKKYRSGARTHSAGHSMNQSRYQRSDGRYYGNPNDRGGLVGGGDPGTYNVGGVGLTKMTPSGH
jgi:hypothetical protein